MNFYGVYFTCLLCINRIASGALYNFVAKNNGTSFNEKFMNIELSPTLRQLETRTFRESTQKPGIINKNELMSKTFSLQRSPSQEEVNAGGMGLLLSERNPISLGHLLSNPKESNARPVQPSSYVIKSEKQTWNSQNPSKSDQHVKRTMRNMGENVVNRHLQPDVTSKLIRRLWSLLQNTDDKHWTSEELPRVLRQRGVSGMMSDDAASLTSSTDTNLVRKANALNLTFRDQSGAQFLLPESQIQIFRNWLIEQATCEMDFIWKDLGSLYWPRWIKMGVCLTRFGGSCSWPPGMKCQPSGSRVLRLLNWNCDDVLQPDTKPGLIKRSPRAIINLPGQNINSILTESPTINLRNHLMSSKIPSGQSPMFSYNSDIRRLYDSNPFQRPPRSYSTNAFWRYNKAYRRKERRDANLNPALGEERKLRRAKRLMEKLSVNSSGFHCSWQIQKYLISDKCTCSCS